MSALEPLIQRRTVVRARLRRVEDDLRMLRDDRAADTADDEHDPDGAPLSGEWSRREGLRRTAAAELARLEEAIAHAAAGGYAVCTGCARQIPPERLRARPDATQCIGCAAGGVR